MYLAFVKRNYYFLLFGLLLATCSGVGQTFFIAIFSGALQTELGLSLATYGLLYSLATFSSGVSIIWLGKALDHIDLRAYTAIILVGLVIAAVIMARSTSATMIFVAFYLLRLCGQGLLSHAAVTTMARYFEEDRGKAVSIGSFGHPLSEICFPILAVTAMTQFGWRTTWLGIAGVVTLFFLPLAMLLLRGHTERHRHYLANLARRMQDWAASTDQNGEFTRRQVLADSRFYLLIPAILAPPFINTGIFFYQVHISQIKDWGPEIFALGFATYAITSVMTAFVAGIVVDRFGAFGLLRIFLLPFIIALFALGNASGVWVIHFFMIGAALSTGMYIAISGCIWPELYGTRHLGSIRAMASSIMVFSTSISPFLFGWLFERGATLSIVTGGTAVYCIVASGLAMAAHTKNRRASRMLPSLP